jgi:succinyl-diaminopimelate desuccinylase
MKDINELTKDLMNFKTVKSNDQEFNKAFKYIEDYFSAPGLEIYRHEKDGFHSMVVATDEDPDLMLHGHVDVVDADEDMFNPEERDGRIYGRGSADMKSGLACLMKALKEVSENSDISAGLMIVSDEEIGGFNGAQYLTREKRYSPEFAVSAEPNTSEDSMEIVTAQKGIMRIVIWAEGDGAHGSTPRKGDNAAEKLWEKFGEFKRNFSMEKDWATTVNLGYFNAEGAMNVVPDRAEAGLDVRYTEEYPPEEIVRDLDNIEDLKFKVEAEDPPLKTSRENEDAQKLEEISSKIVRTKVSRKNAASDMRHFSEQGIPAVVAGPKGGNIHGKDEYVEKESMNKFYRIIKEFLKNL